MTRAEPHLFDLVTNRSGSHFYVKPVKESKDMSWLDSIASVCLKVGKGGNLDRNIIESYLLRFLMKGKYQLLNFLLLRCSKPGQSLL